MREFFQRVLRPAEKRGHVTYWGEVAFSIRAHFPETGLTTFAYGWPSGVFQFYCHEDLLPLSVEEVSILRKELLDFGVFKERGRWTLKAIVTKDNLARMNEVYDFILDKMDEIVKTH